MNRAHYRDRTAAGGALASELAGYRGVGDLTVIGLARGGVPVAAPIAALLRADFDVGVVRKLGAPGHEELAIGAISATRMVVNDRLIRSLEVSEATLAAIVERERCELRRREERYRDGRPPVAVAGRTVILVDDGIATGATMRVVAMDVRAGGADRVVVAVPTAPPEAAAELADVADDFVCPYQPTPFHAVGMSYRHFDQVSDSEVVALLAGRG
jgi:putative phosphoribosyl transferase